MAESNITDLNCWYCLESEDSATILGHDRDFRLVCTKCQPDLPADQTVTPWQTVDSAQLKAAWDHYQATYQAFQTSQAGLIVFYQQTKNLPWRLRPGSHQQQPTWLEHYQAAVKTIDLISDQFDLIKSYLQRGRVVSCYPRYDLSRPGKVVKVKSGGTSTTKVVVSDHYFTTMAQIIQRLPDRPDREVRIKLMVECFSFNSNLTLDWILAYPDWPWLWTNLHRNPNFELSWVIALPHQNWDFQAISALLDDVVLISYHPQLSLLHYLGLAVHTGTKGQVDRLTLTNLQKLLTMVPVSQIDTFNLCQRIDLNQTGQPDQVLEFLQTHQLVNTIALLNNPTIVWSWLNQPAFQASLSNQMAWDQLAGNTALPVSLIEQFYRATVVTGSRTKWPLHILSNNPALHLVWLEQVWFQPQVNQSAYTWNWCSLSSHPEANLDFILSHPRWSWLVLGLADNPNFSPEWLTALSQYDWSGVRFSSTNLAKFSWSQLLDGCLGGDATNWPWFAMSSRADLTWAVIKEYPQWLSYWHWSQLCLNPNLAWADEPLWLDNQDKWDFHSLSRNPGLNFARFKDYITDHWDLGSICSNSMVVL